MQIAAPYKVMLDKASITVIFGNHQIPGTGKINEYQ
jgi:hypothetical protein